VAVGSRDVCAGRNIVADHLLAVRPRPDRRLSPCDVSAAPSLTARASPASRTPPAIRARGHQARGRCQQSFTGDEQGRSARVGASSDQTVARLDVGVPDAGPALDSPTGDRRPSQPRGCLGGHQPVGAGFRQARWSGRRPCRQHTIGPGRLVPAHGRRLGIEEHRLAVAQLQSVAAELLVGDLALSTNASATSPTEQSRAGSCFRRRPGQSRRSTEQPPGLRAAGCAAPAGFR
jgi:hypothetical protein